MRRFPESPITSLLDDTPLYNLGESTCRDLTLEELLGAGDMAGLAELGLGYGTSAGDSALRHLIASAVGVDDDQVLVTAGAASALFLLELLVADGDAEIVVVRPCFPPVMAALEGIGARVVTVPVRFDDGYRLESAALGAALSPQTRLVVLTSPQNPSGVTTGAPVVQRILDAMAAVCPQALLLVDETFRETVYGTAPVPASLAGLDRRVLTCASVSKSHGAPGLRIGWLTVPDADLRDQLRLAKFNIGIACGTLDEVLAARLLHRADAILAWRRAFLADALRVVESWVDGHAELVEWVRPQGGAFCCVRLAPGTFAPAHAGRFYAQVAERRTLVAPGQWFGDDPAVFRLGFGFEPISKLQAGLGMIDAALRATSVP
jgi:DNA-binding transcriptional MocR family regulator